MANRTKGVYGKGKIMKFYMHSGSLNHGCEAIVRSTANMTNDQITLYSEHPNEDMAVELNKICKINVQGGKRSPKNPVFIFCKIVEMLFKNSNLKHWYSYKNVVSRVKPGELFLSIGGDNYCYGANPYLIYLNKKLNKKGAKTGLWGCSIEPKVIENPEIIEDMKRYSFISARESITYNALKEKGLTNVYLYPDPAFGLEIEECNLPTQFTGEGVVGINISPLVEKLDSSSKLVLENYVNLVRYILEKTKLNIVLIPHVCKKNNDDRESLRLLASLFPDSSRIVMVNEEGTMDCRKLKYIISKCRYIVTARTHASIAAYSTCIPTLVVGYSVKAQGIAKDIFETSDKYVVDIYKMKKSTELQDSFIWLMNNEDSIKKKLDNKMKDYIVSAKQAKVLIKA